MKKRRLTKGAAEFDRRLDEGEDIHDIVDLSKAAITHPGRKVRITLDIPEELVREIDSVRQRIGVDRGALIKVWLHERTAQEKARQGEGAHLSISSAMVLFPEPFGAAKTLSGAYPPPFSS